MKHCLVFLAFLMSLSFSLAPAQAAFSDVSFSHPYGDAIEFVQQESIVQGYSDGTYRPEQSINRAEFTKILIEAFFQKFQINNCVNTNPDLFTDVDTSDWFAPYVCVAKQYYIIEGYPDGSFGPSKSINFAEAAKIVVLTTLPAPNAAGEGEAWFVPYVNLLQSLEAVPRTIQDSSSLLTRGEMAALIYYIQTDATSSHQIITSTTQKSEWGCDNDSISVEGQQINSFRLEVIDLVNQERAKAGLSPLTLNCKLESSAQGHSNDMRQQNYFSHTSLDGRTEQDRIAATGYLQPYDECNCSKSYTAGENIAKGQVTAAEVMEHWMNSPLHRDNILNPDYSEIGIGITPVNPNESNFIGYFWVQNFGDVSLNL